MLQPSSAVQLHQRALPASNAAAATTEEDVTAHVGDGASEGALLPAVERPDTGNDPGASSPANGHPSVHWADQQPDQQQKQQQQHRNRQLDQQHSGNLNFQDADARDANTRTTSWDGVAAVLPTTVVASSTAAADDGFRASANSNSSNRTGTSMTGGRGFADVPGSQVELSRQVPTAQGATVGNPGGISGSQCGSPPALTDGAAGSQSTFDRQGVPEPTPSGGSPPVSPTAPRHTTSHTHTAAATVLEGVGLPRHRLRRAVTEPRKRWSSAGAVGGERALSRCACSMMTSQSNGRWSVNSLSIWCQKF